jgi:hypothetical protein
MPADLNQLDQQAPAMDPTTSPEMGDMSQDAGELPGETDREGAMAKADLFKLANYSHKLFGQLQDDQQLEAWVQAKITKAADYIASVYHYLEYEMKFSEYGHHLDNSDTLSEGQRMKIKELLAEAKDKMKDLKKTQAEKMKEKKVEEGILSGGHKPCEECQGTGMVYHEPTPIPAHVQGKVAKYKTLVKATKAAHRRMGDEELVDEEYEETTKTQHGSQTAKFGKDGKRKSVTHKDERKYSDEPHAEPASQAKSRSADEKKAEKDADKKQTQDTKNYEKKYPGTVTKVVGGKKVDPNAPKKKKEEDDDLDENFGQGIYEAKKKNDGNLANNAKPYDKVTRGDVIAGRLGKDEEGGKAVKEAAKPSAGLSKAKKSAVVKKAKAGGDIGKPGKSFDKVAKSAGGGEKGEKIAAAAMWKNIKETTAYVEEKAKATKDLPGNQEKIDVNKNGKIDGDDLAKLRAGKKETVKESTEIDRLRQLTGRLNQTEKPALVENREVDQIRAMTKRLLG